VRAAIDDLVAHGTVVVTLVSDVPTSRRAHFVGIDNVAAGRTAATLLGRFVRPDARGEARIGIVLGSRALRDHAERMFGFQQVIASEFPQLSPLPAFEGRDETQRCRLVAEKLLAEQPNLVGIYSVGAGNRGIAEALEAAGRARDVIFIAHELTDFSRRYLIHGTMAAIINQDPGHEARSAARILLARCTNQHVIDDQERIRIDIFLRDNLP